MSTNIIVPSNDKERKKLKAMLVEMTNSFSKVDAERDACKEIADEAVRQFELPKKIINKLARTMYKRNYADLQQENEDFELLYETLVPKAGE
jgi:hypothetical protein